MRSVSRLLASVGFLLWCAAPGDAQTAAAVYVGRPVSDVRVLIEGRQSDDPSLRDLLQTRVGAPLSMTEVRESIEHLYTLGRFQDIRVEAASAAAGGVSLEFDLVPLHSVGRIEFRGDVGLSEGDLRRAVADRYGTSPPIGRAADMAATLERLYRDRGYFSASVKPIAEEHHDPDRTILTFEIQSGPQARIAKARVEGPVPESEAELLRTLRASSGEAYQPPEIQRRLTEYLGRLRQRGYYEASGRVSADPAENGMVDLSIEVTVGPKVSVRFEGDQLPAARLKDLVPVEREGSVEEDMLEDSSRRIEAYLKDQGYWKATAPYRREDAEGALAIVFTITRGRQYHVSEVSIRGNRAVAVEELRALVPIKPGELFVDSRLSAGTAAIAEDYRKRGFASASVKPGVNELDPPGPGQGLVRLDIVVEEGPRTLIGDVTITGSTALGAEELRPLIHARTGDPFYPPSIAGDRDAIIVRYLNLGHASADVTVAPTFSEDRTRVDLDFRIAEGPQTLVDHILIVGNTKTDPKVILREMRLKPGQPLGLEDQIESQRALNALGLFRRVRITELRHGETTRHDILVTVDEAPRTTISYGGGAEATQRARTAPDGTAEQRLEFAPRGFFDIGRRNVGGKNRTVDLYTRVSLRPRDAPEDPSQDGKGYGLSQYRIVGTYREPRAIVGSDFTLTAAAEQGIRSSFNFTRKGISADLVRRLSPSIRVTGRYSLNTTRTFDERLSEEDQATIDRLFPQVRLSVLSGAIARDTRDDILEPSRGTFVSAEGSMAARALGGEVGFLKTYLQGFWFRRLPGPRRIVFASRAAIGMADGFPREVQVDDGSGGTRTELIEDLPASERFFAGGDTSIRGFGLDMVGITPQTISPNGFPRGGNAVIILNAELRVPVWRQVGAAFFVDGGNVWDRVTSVELSQVRGTYGLGLRYQSPVGPIRFDVGFKMDRKVVGGTLEPSRALHFSIGQAF